MKANIFRLILVTVILMSLGSLAIRGQVTNPTIGGLTVTNGQLTALAVQNGTTATIAQVFNTFTSATNFEDFEINWTASANRIQIGQNTGTGGGTNRPMDIFAAGWQFKNGSIRQAGAAVFAIDASGNATVSSAATSGAGISLSTLGRVFTASLTAEGGTKSTLCIDPATNEVESNAAATCTVSSLRYKDWISDLTCTEADRIVTAMRPAIFKDKDGGDGPRFGFAAEWVERVDRRLVDYSNGKPHSVDYERYAAVLTKAQQCSERRIQQTLDRLEREIAKNR